MKVVLKKTLGDSSPDVKQLARSAFWSFNSFWPEAGTKLVASLDGQAKKALERSNPHPQAEAGTSVHPTARVAAPTRPGGVGAQLAAMRKAARQREAEEAKAAAASAAVESEPSRSSTPPPPASIALPPSLPPAPPSPSPQSHASPSPPIASSSSSKPPTPRVRSSPTVTRVTSPPAQSPFRPLGQSQRSIPSSPANHQSPTPKPLRGETSRPSASMSDQGSLMSQEELVSPFLHQSDSRSIPEEEIRSQAEQAVSTAQRLTEVDEQQQQEQENSLENGAGRGGESSNAKGLVGQLPSTYDRLKTGQPSSLHTPIKHPKMREAVSYQNSPQVPDGSSLSSMDALRKIPADGWRKKMHREFFGRHLSSSPSFG